MAKKTGSGESSWGEFEKFRVPKKAPDDEKKDQLEKMSKEIVDLESSLENNKTQPVLVRLNGEQIRQINGRIFYLRGKILELLNQIKPVKSK
jgi:TolA-binding protein